MSGNQLRLPRRKPTMRHERFMLCPRHMPLLRRLQPELSDGRILPGRRGRDLCNELPSKLGAGAMLRGYPWKFRGHAVLSDKTAGRRDIHHIPSAHQ